MRQQPAAAGAGVLRFVSAASLFDGHDAAINMIRRLLQSSGAEVVHLGHNRSVSDIVRAAIQEDADGIAVSSYQGGHNEYFKYMVDMLQGAGLRAHPRGRRRRRHDRAATRSRCWKTTAWRRSTRPRTAGAWASCR